MKNAYTLVRSAKVDSSGYTLVELLVVMSLLAIVGVISYVNIGVFRQDKDLIQASLDLQNHLREAQTNATSSTTTLCTENKPSFWKVIFNSRNQINLKCGETGGEKNWIISDKVSIDSIKGSFGSSSCDSSFNPNSTSQVELKFNQLSGNAEFIDLNLGSSCLANSEKMVISLKSNSSSSIKTVTINKGGSIEVSK